MANPMLEAYYDIPPVTRVYTTLCLITTILVQLDLVSPLQLYYNSRLVFRRAQVWRLATTFLYFGQLGFGFMFNMIFAYRYCRMLEENHYRWRTADFVFLFLFGAVMTLLIVTVFYVQMLFLGHSFTIMLVYIWSRRNPWVRLNFFGLFTVSAPYLPYVLVGISLLLGSSPVTDIVGILVGHTYYYLEDIYPAQPNGFRILQTPRFMKALFDAAPASQGGAVRGGNAGVGGDDVNVELPAENRPGGWPWQQQQQEPAAAPQANRPRNAENEENNNNGDNPER